MLIAIILWVGVLAALSALVAGGIFAFSTIVLRGLRSLPMADSIRAMNAINRVAAKPLKLLLFGTALLCLVLAVALIWSWGHWTHQAELGAAIVIAGGVAYVLGAVTVTLERNVPLNKLLDTATDASGAMVWRIYLRDWAKWNHVRTIACAAACALLVAGMVLHTFGITRRTIMEWPPPIVCPDVICVACQDGKTD